MSGIRLYFPFKISNLIELNKSVNDNFCQFPFIYKKATSSPPTLRSLKTQFLVHRRVRSYDITHILYYHALYHCDTLLGAFVCRESFSFKLTRSFYGAATFYVTVDALHHTRVHFWRRIAHPSLIILLFAPLCLFFARGAQSEPRCGGNAGHRGAVDEKFTAR